MNNTFKIIADQPATRLIRITKRSPSWAAWMAHVASNPALGWVNALEACGNMRVETQWPPAPVPTSLKIARACAARAHAGGA